MPLEDKATYGEYYWAMQVEAQKAYDEELEAVFAPYFRGILNDLPSTSQLPSGIRKLLYSLADPPSAGFGGFALGVGVEMIDETLHTLMNPAMKMMGRSINRRAKETWLTSTQANKLFREGKIGQSYWRTVTESEGYEGVIAKQLYEAEMPFMSVPDIVRYARYHGNPYSLRSTVWDIMDVPVRDIKVWDWLSQQQLTTLEVQTLFRRNVISHSSFYDKLSRIGWSSGNRSLVKEVGWSIPNAMLMVQGDLMQRKSTTDILRHISIADIHPEYAKKYLDAVLTKPSTQDIIAYGLRQDPGLSGLNEELRRIGIHEDYHHIYRELAQVIPPVADIITMAVREAFSPGIAARFGQYQDFPAELEFWAAKKGLSVEWARRYWAAHWSLPSPLQGFEMLHRGAINMSELNMLLRALDIMPFWRGKLTKIAYRRITRVDIRRMYKAGTIKVSDVLKANLELGYNARDAKRMTDFTVQWALPKHASITRSDILTAYKNRMIDRAEASQLLENMGEDFFHRSFMMDAVDYKKGLELTELQIKGIGNLYKRRAIDNDKARDDLLRLDLPADEVDSLMTEWYYEVKAQIPRNWTTSQTLSFAKDGLITKDRAKQELEKIGYDAEHVDIYMRDVK